jgi:hypothetical protein
MLFSTVFLFALYVSRPCSVLVEVQLERSMPTVFGRLVSGPSLTRSHRNGWLPERTSLIVLTQGDVLLLCDPNALKQHGRFSIDRDDGPELCQLTSTRYQVQAHSRKLESFP